MFDWRQLLPSFAEQRDACLTLRFPSRIHAYHPDILAFGSRDCASRRSSRLARRPPSLQEFPFESNLFRFFFADVGYENDIYPVFIGRERLAQPANGQRP